MAHIMKISVVKLNGENVIIPLIKTETLEAFRSRAFKEYNLEFDNDHFNDMFLGLPPKANLFECLNSQTKIIADNHNNEEITDLIYEIHMSANETHSESNEFNIENDEQIMETDEEIPYGVSNLPLIEINNSETNTEFSDVLAENIFDVQQNNNLNLSPLQIIHSVTENVENKNNINNDHNNKKDTSEATSETLDEQEKSFDYLDIETKLREIHESNEKVTDFCRLCAKPVTYATKVNIFNSDDELNEKINKYLPISVKVNDGLPQQICENCAEQIKKYYEFVQGVVDANNVIRLKFRESIKNSEQSSELLKTESKQPNDNIKKEEMGTEYVIVDKHETKSESTLKCQICNLVLQDIESTIKHCSESHVVNDFTACALCEYGFDTNEQFTEHFQTEHSKQFKKPVKYQCTKCGYKSLSLKLLQKHNCIKMKNRTLHCEVCNEAFPTKIRLNFHRQLHLKNARPLTCFTCNIVLEDENEYFDHVNFIHDAKQVYVCDICDKTFNIKSTLANHRKIHSGVRNHKCEVCDKTFFDKQTLKEHQVTHMDNVPFQCDKCGKNFNRLSRLKQHLLTHESNPIENDIHVCEKCKETFKDEEEGLQHKKTYHPNEDCIEICSTDRVFRCEYCEKCFISHAALNIHRLVHTGPTPFSCHICKVEFASYSRCTAHKATHGVYKDDADKETYPVVKHFLCEHCGKSYLHWSYLGLHKRLKHSPNAPVFKCTDCSMQFQSNTDLVVHRKNKHQEEQYKCNECGKYMSNLQIFKIHQRTVHSASKDAFRCEKCAKSFNSQVALDGHLKLHQGIREYKCNFCPKTFVHPSSLSNHLKQHVQRIYTCSYCDKKFPSRKECFEHEATHAKGKHACDICPKVFDTKSSLMIHNKTHDVRPFSCDICGLSFRRSFTLRTHKNKHKKQSGNFVLMVDMKEDNFDNFDLKESTNPSECVETVINEENEQPEHNLVELNTEMSGNFIDIGNGTYLPIQGNTITIGGKQYFLINEQPKNDEQPQIQMVVDNNETEVGQISTVTNEQYTNNTVMLVDENSIILNQNDVQPEYIFTTTEGNVKPNTFIVGNQLMLETEEQSF